MKKIAFLSVVVLMLGLAGCTKNPGCVIQDTIVSALAPTIATGLQCSNPAAIQTTLTGIIQKTGMCTQQAEVVAGLPTIGVEACKFVGNLVIAQVAGQAIPAEWGCTADNAKAKLADLIAQGCAKL